MFVHKIRAKLEKIRNEDIPQIQRISDESIQALFHELDELKQDLLKRQRETIPEEIPSLPDDHPLFRSCVLERLVNYLDTPGPKPTALLSSKSSPPPESQLSYEFLRNVQLVCTKWQRAFNPTFRTRSIFSPCYAGVDQLIDTFRLDVDVESFNTTNFHIPDLSLLNNSPEFRHWLSVYGSRFTEVRLGTLKQDEIQNMEFPYFRALLRTWCPNLQDLTLINVMVKCMGKTQPMLSDAGEDIQFLRLNKFTVQGYEDTHFFEDDTLMQFPTQRTQQYQLTQTAVLVSRHCREMKEIYFDSHYDWKYFPTVFNENPNAFANLTSCDIINYSERVLPMLVNIDFPILEKLTLVIPIAASAEVVGSISKFLQTIKTTLKHLHLIDKRGAWLSKDKESGEIEDDLPILETLIYSDAFEIEDHNEFQHNEMRRLRGQTERTTPIVTAKHLFHSFPNLRVWEIKQTKLNGFEDDIRSCCENGLCNLVDKVLSHKCCKSTKHGLEELSISCAFHAIDSIQILRSRFPNVQKLSIRIHTTELQRYFEVLSTLRYLQNLEIKLDHSIVDFPTAINKTLPRFRNLKEICFRKLFWLQDNISLANLDQADIGFAGCKRLRMLTFKDLTIPADELETLRNELRKPKPDLVMLTC